MKLTEDTNDLNWNFENYFALFLRTKIEENRMESETMQADVASTQVEMQNLRITGVGSGDIMVFDEKEPKIVLIDVLQPIVEMENCIWLEEI